MERLSSPIRELKGHYPIVVVGSGYGGSIAAARFAAAGRRVAVLERGREFQPGEYPDTLASALAEFQVDLPGGHVNRRGGLYDLRMNGDVSVILGCGLGGGSLVNVGVALVPDDEVFADTRWPAALRAHGWAALRRGFARAFEMLEPATYPERLPRPRKVGELERIAAITRREDAQLAGWPGRPPRPYEGLRFDRLPVNVTFTDRVNAAGVAQPACRLCGDCMSGCNYGAKNTLIMNYLPVARRHRAKLFTGIRVTRLESHGGHWLVFYEVLDCGRDLFDAPEMFLTANTVVLAAGTLGSTEILLRSRARLGLSDHLGRHFSGNGDYLAFAYHGERKTNPLGAGRRQPDDVDPVGPMAAAILDLRRARQGQPLDEGIVIEEGSLAGAMAPVFPGALAAARLMAGEAPDVGLARSMTLGARRLARSFRPGTAGPLGRTLVYLVMGHDQAQDAGRETGTLELTADGRRLVVRWPNVEAHWPLDIIHRHLGPASSRLRASYISSPSRPITAHPLGGCRMGETVEDGVVDDLGRVFDAARPGAIHPGLFVLDGSVIPRSLGVNPLFTISAVAERACAGLLARGLP